MRHITWLIALVLAAGALTAAGCGGDDSSSSGSSSGGTGTSSSSGSGGGGQTLTVTADPGGAIKWDKTKLDSKACMVSLKLVNDSEIPLAIEIEGNGVEEQKTDVITKSSADVTVDLKPGTYKYYCPVAQHRQTMKGTLTVS